MTIGRYLPQPLVHSVQDNMVPFLQNILGEEASQALDRAVARIPELSSVIVPRAIISWLNLMGRFGYEGEIPGQDNSYFSIVKTENDTFTGALTIDKRLYSFENADLLHVAASFGVALGIESQPIDEELKKRDLTDLGKNIDLLVKSNLVYNFKKSSQSNITKYGDFRVDNNNSKYTVKYTPTDTVIADNLEHLSDAVTIANWCLEKSELGLEKPKNQIKVHVSMDESKRACEECGELQILDNAFVGCLCYNSLSKSVKLKKNPNSFTLIFNNDLDSEAISALISFFKD